MPRSKTIPTKAPMKGDFVVGHQAAAFFADPDLPAVRGRIVEVSPSGHEVVFEVDQVLAMLGIPRRTRWTWRASVLAYQQKGSRTRKGEGLALVCLPAVERAAA